MRALMLTLLRVAQPVHAACPAPLQGRQFHGAPVTSEVQQLGNFVTAPVQISDVERALSGGCDQNCIGERLRRLNPSLQAGLIATQSLNEIPACDVSQLAELQNRCSGAFNAAAVVGSSTDLTTFVINFVPGKGADLWRAASQLSQASYQQSCKNLVADIEHVACIQASDHYRVTGQEFYDLAKLGWFDGNQTDSPTELRKRQAEELESEMSGTLERRLPYCSFSVPLTNRSDE